MYGKTSCVIKYTKISLVPFDEVSPEHAFNEGEGDCSLEYRRQVHREAFTPDYAAAGLPFNEKGICVLMEFEVVYR